MLWCAMLIWHLFFLKTCFLGTGFFLNEQKEDNKRLASIINFRFPVGIKGIKSVRQKLDGVSSKLCFKKKKVWLEQYLWSVFAHKNIFFVASRTKIAKTYPKHGFPLKNISSNKNKSNFWKIYFALFRYLQINSFSPTVLRVVYLLRSFKGVCCSYGLVICPTAGYGWLIKAGDWATLFIWLVSKKRNMSD